MARCIDATAAEAVTVSPEDDSAAAGCGCIRWVCIRAWPGTERWATGNLELQGFVAYLPLFTQLVRGEPVERPLFAGYAFCQHDPATSWGPIRDTPGVRSVIRSGNRIQYARNGAVEALQAGEAVRRTLTPPEALWRPGEACRLVLGALCGQDAVVEASGERLTRVTVLMFGHLRTLEVPTRYLGRRD